ncbi:MAG: hypothetical protein ACRCSG_04530 [Cellulosilyticaceae bacterium]
MKKILAGVLISSLILVATTYAANNDAGSQNDPLVTKSYVDELVKELEKTNSNKYEIVEVEAGQVLEGHESTEMILRAGEGNVIESSGGGIQDITDGLDLKTSVNVPKNHLLLIPRGDGRGILAKTNIIVMVRGGYTIH